MTFHILTIFPEVFDPYLKTSILGRAQEKGLAGFNLIDLRDFTADKHRSVDDVPFGGGAGMILKIEPIYKAVKFVGAVPMCPPSSEVVKSLKFKVKSLKKDQNLNIKEDVKNPESRIPNPENTRIILLSAKGRKFTQEKARELSQYENVVLICGRYEGVDERVAEYIADEEISIGDYVLTGGELPAMVVADAVTRLVPGVISEDSLREESFNQLRITNYELRNNREIREIIETKKTGNWKPDIGNLKFEIGNFSLEYPQYTRPAVFKTDEGEEWAVPDVLLSGNHGEIEKWRKGKSKISNITNISKKEILTNICYTELVYERINKKLDVKFSKKQIEEFIFKILKQTEEKFFSKIGKNFYVINTENNIKITINSSSFRIITVDKIKR